MPLNVKKFTLLFSFIVIVLFMGGCAKPDVILDEVIPYSEIQVEESLLDDKFYYNQCTEDEQLVYKEIYQGLSDYQEEIYLHTSDAEVANTLLLEVLHDFPEIFWSDGRAVSTTYGETYTVIEPEYVYALEEKQKMEAEIETVVSEIIDSIPTESNEYEKIKYIYEYLIQDIAYVEDSKDNQNIYSAFVRKETVCAGYAKANQYLLNRLGIYCSYVMGTAESEGKAESHAWNIVRCNGNYYYVDVTWADPLFTGKKPATGEEIQYDYLCCNENTIAGTHKKEKGYEYPECSLDDLNYYRMKGVFYETADEQELLSKMYQSIDAKEASITFKFSDSATYQKAKPLLSDKLLNTAGEYLCEKYNLKQVQCFYQEHDDLNKFVIYWAYE